MSRRAAPPSNGPADAVTVAQPARVRIAPHLARLFGDAPAVTDIAASSVRDLVEILDERWPGMRDRICDTRPAIRRHMNIFVDGRRATLATPLRPGADVYILTAISGG
jgi:molybdopterin synthase sulfur carrier subunit